MNDEEIRVDGRMSFRPEEVADGKMERLLKVLTENHCEIRLWTDGYCYIVEYLEDITTEDGIHFRPSEF